MALPTKKYFIYIIFLFSLITLSLYAQDSKERLFISMDVKSDSSAYENQNKDTADYISKFELDNCIEFILGSSIPEDGLLMATETKNQTSNCEENKLITGSYSLLAKEIIDNYRYDFSKTFIDILFFENIDLARKRTI